MQNPQQAYSGVSDSATVTQDKVSQEVEQGEEHQVELDLHMVLEGRWEVAQVRMNSCNSWIVCSLLLLLWEML